VPSSDAAERLHLALPPLDARALERAAERDWDVDLLDPTDPDERAILIRLAHPELDEADEAGAEKVVVRGKPMSPRLHFAVHELVASQVIDGDPPEAFATLKRLLASGRDHHEALHMLASVVSTQLWTALHEQRPYGAEAHVRALGALPGSWDAQMRGGGDRGRTQAAGRAHRRRRR
jgi:hypothetical protein